MPKQLNQLQSKEIFEVLTTWGLSPKEQTVYLGILSEGSTTITPLGRLLGLPPTTVQSILMRLATLGIVTVEKRKSRHIFTAAKPNILKLIMEERAREVGTIVPLLESLARQESAKAKVRIFYRERVADILQLALETKSKLVYEIVAARPFQELIGEKFHFTKRRMEKHISLKSLRVEDQEIKKYSRNTHISELREAKFLPREFTFESTVMFWDKTVAIFSTKSEGLAIVIESRVIAEFMLQLFNMLWSVSRTMET